MKTIPLFLTFMFMVLSIATPLQAKDKFLKSEGQELRYREASSYANQAEERDIMVGVEFLPKSEQKRLLGNPNGKYAVLEVAITNNSRFRLYVNTIDFVDADTKLATRAISLDAVAKASGPSGGGNKKGMRLSILRNNLIDKSLQARVVLPGETVQGLVFMNAKLRRKGAQLRLDVQNLKRLVYLDILVPLAR